jgi:hypothetical protein
VVLEIPTSAVHFEKNGNTNRARFRIIGLVRDARSTAIMRFGGDTQFDATDAEYNLLKPGNLSFVNTLHLPSGVSYAFEVFVKDLLSGKISRAISGLYLRPADPGLALSTILLARDVEKAGRESGQFLSVGGVKILPSARCEFRNGDRLIFYLDVYNPSEQPDKKTDLSLDVSILKGGEPVNLKVPEYHMSQPVAEPVPHVTVARYVELTGLAPGEYSLVVNVKDRMTARRLGARAEFSVAN